MAKIEIDMEEYKDLSKDEILLKEKKKLEGIYGKLDVKTKKSVSSLIENAAFMSASLYDLRKIINEKGYVEEYQNGQNQRGMKKCSEVEIYNTMIKNYMACIKQLTDLLPKQKEKEPDDGFDDFVNSRG